MPSNVPHTKLRGGIYHYHRRIPQSVLGDSDALQRFRQFGNNDEYFKSSELCRGSLKTRERNTAILKAAALDEEFDRRVAYATGTPTTATDTAATRVAQAPVIDEDLLNRLTHSSFEATVKQYRDLYLKSLVNDDYKAIYEGQKDRIEADPEHFRASIFGGNVAEVREEVELFLTRIGRRMPSQPYEQGKVIEAWRKGLRLAYMKVQNIFEDNSHIKVTDPSLEAGKAVAEKAAKSRSLSEALDAMKAVETLKPSWKDKCEKAVEAFEDICGAGVRLTDIDKSTIQTFISTLKKTPANRRQRFPSMTIAEAIAANLKKDPPVPTLSEKSVYDGYLAPINRIINYAVEQNWIDLNPATGVKKPVKASSRSKVRSFRDSELSKLFSHPAFTGCASASSPYNGRPGAHKINDVRFWGPLLALYTGARAAELAGIKLSEIHLDGDQPFIEIRRNEYRDLKTTNSRRDIPLPAELISLGFDQFVRGKRSNGHSRLFEDWEKREKSTKGLASYSDAKWLVNFRRFSKRLLGAKGERSEVVFHSFRKNYKQALHNMGVPPQYTDEVVGHDKSAMDKIYGQEVISANVPGPHVKGLSYPPVKVLIDQLRRH